MSDPDPKMNRRRLLEKLLKEKAATASTYPQSFGQQRLWFIDQLASVKTGYNTGQVICLEGALDVDALERALIEIIRRHDILRTRFIQKEDEPVQQVTPLANLKLEVIDLGNTSGARQQDEIHRIAQDKTLAVIDLANGPLFEASLVRLNDSSHVLILVMHHIITDAWSMRVFYRELSVLYNAYVNGSASPLSRPALQYADFTQWQSEFVQGDRGQQQLDYWRQKLAGAPPVLELPTDFHHPPVQSYKGGLHKHDLSTTLVERLDDLASQHNSSLFMVMLSAFYILLWRYTGQHDIVVGSPVAGRNRTEFEELIGLFINVLPLRAKIDGETSFLNMLEQVRKVSLEALSHQDAPFDALVSELNPERTQEHHPIYQVMFTLQQPLLKNFDMQGVKCRPLTLNTRPLTYDLTMVVTEEYGETSISIDYSKDLFMASTIERMAGHYEQLLLAVGDHPESRLCDLPMATPAESTRLLVDWNRTQTDYPRESSIAQLFGEQAAHSPDAVALVYEGCELSYGELNVRANQVAHYLLHHGMSPEVMVGVCVERSLEMVIGVLGILKAGGAYVPLDPEYPAQRLAFMLEDTEAPVLLTQSGLLERLPDYAGQVVCLDRDWGEIALESSEDPQLDVGAKNLAYVIYTSGSTGQPKGVCIEQRSVVRLVKSTNYVELGADEVFLQFAPISFDASTFELWGSLLNGARLVIFPPGVLSLEELGRVIREQGVSTLWLTAALFNQMVDKQIENLRGVRQLLAGGETLSAQHVRRMLAALGEGGRLINGYGPTENTTFTCCHVMEAGSRIEQTVPIGRPISNTRVYILDAQMQPAPVGVYGELYIGGDGLAREYWRQPQLTAEKFVPDPFTDDAEAWLYRTGDRVRYRDDGAIEFLGRFDHQVKLRGFRIELGEVEAVLGAHDSVQDAVVLMREDEPGDRRLVGYVVLKEGEQVTPSEIKHDLGRNLPDYMLPSVLVVLDELPLNANGKVDREALPAPSGERQVGTAYAPPRTDAERGLAGIWTELLMLEKIGIDDNFFDLGGNSLLLLRTHGRVNELLNAEMPVTELFRYPTIRGLARYGAAAGEETRVEKIQERARKQKDAMQRRKRLIERQA